MSSDPQALGRPSAPEAEALAVDLADAKAAGIHRTLILGAGASAAAGLPTFKELCKKLIKRSRLKYEGPDPIAFVQEYFAKPERPRDLALQGVIRPVKPTIGYLHLAQLLEKAVFDLVLTTNWDSLVENALADMAPAHHYQLLSRKQVPDSLVVQYLKRPPAPNLLIKLHGDLSGRLFMALTRDEIQRVPSSWRAELLSRLGDRVVIVGHSIQDPDICDLLGNRTRTSGRVTYVNPHRPQDSVIDAAGLQHAEFITGDAGKFDRFMGDLHVAYEEACFEEDPPDLHGIIANIREVSERGSSYLDNANAREKIGRLKRLIARSDPDLVLFIYDPADPGGSEIQSWLNLEPGDRTWREFIVIVQRDEDSGSSGWRVDLGSAAPALESRDVFSVILVDSCAFSGETVRQAAQAVHRTVRELRRRTMRFSHQA